MKHQSLAWAPAALFTPRGPAPILLLLLLFLLARPVVALAQYGYTNNVDGTISITAYNGPDPIPPAQGVSVSIPGTIDGLTVTAIGENAFRDANVTSVTFPNSVVSIGAFAFAYTALASVTIPDNVTDVGAFAFNGCYRLTQAAIGKNVTRIGDGAFAGCAKLPAITVSPLNPAYVVIDGVLFNHDQTQLIQYPAGKTDSAYTIPGSVTIVGAGAFGGGFLTSLAIPDGVTNLANASFEDSYGSTTSYGLSGLYGLTNIMVAPLNAAYASVNGVLFNHDQTQLIQYPAGKTNGAYTIPDSVINVSAASFQSAENLTNITIGSHVTSIQTAAFVGCWRLARVTIPDNVTDLGDAVFRDCLSLTNVIIGSGVPRIGHEAFDGCNHLTSLTIGEGVTSIGDSAFMACTYLPNVTIPNSVTNIGFQAFWNIGLTNVTFGTGLTTISEGAFSGCYGLTSAYFKGNAPTIVPSPVPEFVSGVFDLDDELTIYYLPGATGWGSTFAGHPAVLLDPQETAVQISYNFESGSFQNGSYEDLATYNPIGNAQFVITNGTLAISEPASPVPDITPAVAAIHSTTVFTNLEESIDFKGWNNSAEARPVIFLTARETAKDGGAYDFYSVSVTPAPFPEAIPPYTTAAGLSITRWSNNVPLVPALSLTPTTLVLDPAKWYHLTFSVVGDTLTGNLYDHDNLTTPILVTTARDTNYTQGFAGFSLTDKGLQGNPKLNNPIQITVDNFYAAEIPPEPAPLSYNFDSGIFANGAYEEMTAYNPIGNDKFVISNGVLSVSAPASVVPDITPAIAGIYSATARSFTNVEESVDFTGWNVEANARPLIYLTARGTDKGANQYDFYSVNLAASQAPEAIPPATTNAGLSISHWINSLPLVPALAYAPATKPLSSTNWYRMTFTVQGEILTGKLYDLNNLTTPLLTATARDTSYANGYVGVFVTDKGLQGNPKLNNPIQATLDNFYAAEIPITPSLTIERAVVLSWPASYAGYILEGAGTSNGPWLPAGVTPALQGSENVATVKVTNDLQFFRLRKPAN